MDFKVALRDYITEHEISNCSDHTIKQQKRVLSWFIEWLGTEYNIHDTSQVRVIHMRGWAAHLQKSPNKNDVKYAETVRLLSDRTVHMYSLIMLSFCHWLEREGLAGEPFTQRFKLPKVEQQFIPTYAPDDIQKLLAACEPQYRGRPELKRAVTARNRAIITVLVDTGIRRKELVGLRLRDIDRDLRVLIVHRKGNKWQQVPISREGFKALHDYITKHRPFLAKQAGISKASKDDAVFLSEHGTPLTTNAITNFFWTLKSRTGIDGKRVCAHNCRRYMATTQIAMGRSVFDVQRQMGHTTLTMTNRYVSQTIEQLQRSHEEYSPLRSKSQGENHPSGSGYWEE